MSKLRPIETIYFCSLAACSCVFVGEHSAVFDTIGLHQTFPTIMRSLLRMVNCGSPRRTFVTTASQHAFDTTTKIKLTSKGTYSSYFEGHITDKFSVGDAPNGGYLCSMAVSAARECIPQFRDPLSITGHYMNKALEHVPCELEVRVLNLAKTSATVEIGISQQNKLMCKFLATFGTLSKFRGLTKIDDLCPELPPVDMCMDASDVMRKSLGKLLKIADMIDARIPKDGAFAQSTLRGKTCDKAELIAWIRFSNERPPCLRSLTFFCDALPPPVLNVSGPSDWVPTVVRSLSYPHPLMPSHTHTHTHTLSYPQHLMPSHNHALSCLLTPTPSHTHILSYPQTLMLTLTPTLSHPHSLTTTPSHTHPFLIPSNTPSHTPSNTPSHTPSNTLCPSRPGIYCSLLVTSKG